MIELVVDCDAINQEDDLLGWHARKWGCGEVNSPKEEKEAFYG
jgi:hypothetical protein